MYDFRKITVFCGVYDCRSFSKAAELLFISQPTVSAHVQSLEKEIGVKLFDRMGRTVVPTPAGKILYEHSVKALGELEIAKSRIDGLLGSISGEIIVGASTIPASYILPDAVASFTAKYPKVNLQLVVGDSALMTRRLLDGDISLAVVGAFFESAELDFEAIADDELVLVASPKLKLDKSVGDTEYLEALESWPWVMREDGSGTRRAFETALMGAGLTLRSLRVVLQVDSAQAALHYAMAGLGVTVTSRLMAHRYFKRGELIELPIAELALKRKFYMARNTRRHLFPAILEFISFVKTNTALLRDKMS